MCSFIIFFSSRPAALFKKTCRVKLGINYMILELFFFLGGSPALIVFGDVLSVLTDVI